MELLPFKPGLVGGHCIGVDPYYLTYKAEETGYRPEIILAGRRLNDGMAEYVASRMIKLMIKRNIQPSGARVLCLGLTFKENCPDVRNTKVADIVRELQTLVAESTCTIPGLHPKRRITNTAFRWSRSRNAATMMPSSLRSHTKSSLRWAPKGFALRKPERGDLRHQARAAERRVRRPPLGGR